MAPFSFACDAMLGSLARWLRLAGFDARYDADLDDEALAALARREERWLLTCDRELAARAGPRVVLLHGAALPDQVAELRGRLPFEADPSLFLTRCSRCNGLLEEVSREGVAELVPPYVAAHAERFSRCRSCGKTYWPGTHHGRIVGRLAQLFLKPLPAATPGRWRPRQGRADRPAPQPPERDA